MTTPTGREPSLPGDSKLTGREPGLPLECKRCHKRVGKAGLYTAKIGHITLEHSLCLECANYFELLKRVYFGNIRFETETAIEGDRTILRVRAIISRGG